MLSGEVGLSWPDTSIISALVLGMGAFLWWMLRRWVRGQFVSESVLTARIADRDAEIERLTKSFADRLADRDKQIEYLLEVTEKRGKAIDVKDQQIDSLIDALQTHTAVVKGIEKAVQQP